MHWTCSIRGGTGSSSHAARVSSRASSTARLAPSPIACTATERPDAADARAISAISAADVRIIPEPSSIQAVDEPSVPSMNAFTGPTRRRSEPKPVRSSLAWTAPICSAGYDMCTRSVSRRSASSRCHRLRPRSRW